MNTPNEVKPRADLRDYLAAERTFLAWIRTGLALMGFGFVVARFGLFLQRLQLFERAGPVSSAGPSVWFGTALIAAGVIVDLSAARQHARLVRQLDRGAPPPSRPLAHTIVIALFLALVGLAMAIYLVSVRNSSNGHSENGKESRVAQPAQAGGIAIDLPLKLPVREDPHGRVLIPYDSPGYPRERHGLPQELLQNIVVVETLATNAGE
ncbi:MAG TPA: DUF202 domain-containing protein [Candidatus Acidoferrales bacterium]|nr:DUF202 domain-containing protein [Candidatus Acidoferrales bacterium]